MGMLIPNRTMGKVIVELPCDIGDYVYEVLTDVRAKEVYLDQYIVQDVSIKAIKFCDDWKERNEVGIRIFLEKETAEQVFENMKNSDEYKNCRFFYGDKEVFR